MLLLRSYPRMPPLCMHPRVFSVGKNAETIFSTVPAAVTWYHYVLLRCSSSLREAFFASYSCPFPPLPSRVSRPQASVRGEHEAAPVLASGRSLGQREAAVDDESRPALEHLRCNVSSELSEGGKNSAGRIGGPYNPPTSPVRVDRVTAWCRCFSRAGSTLVAPSSALAVC